MKIYCYFVSSEAQALHGIANSLRQTGEKKVVPAAEFEAVCKDMRDHGYKLLLACSNANDLFVLVNTLLSKLLGYDGQVELITLPVY